MQPGDQQPGPARYTITEIDLVDTSITSSFLDPDAESYGRLFLRRLLLDQFDVDLLRAFLKECREHHDHSSSARGLDIQSLGNASFRVIDVANHRLVELSTGRPYVALSYTWGGTMDKYPLALALGKDGKLSLENIPPTIRDAIVLTNLLGQKYLWVDWICIKQDDPEDKARLVPRMNVIYESADFTIVAATGKDAGAGIPGLGPNPGPPKLIPP